MSTKTRIDLRPLDLVVIAAVALLGLGHLAYPFSGDQALFAIAARDLDHGAVLYRDVWDFKQPGIFAFYWAAGRLLGFDEMGIHALELAWMLALSLVLVVTLRRWTSSSFAAGLAPLLTVGNYYAISESWHLTQVEGLVGLPMYLALWYASTEARPGRLFVSGAMGGLVLLLKLMFLPILAAFWLTAIAWDVVRHGLGVRRLAAVVAPIVAGCLAPLLVALAYFAWTDSLGVAAWTWFDFPRAVVREIPTPSVWRLVTAVEWFAKGYAWLLALAVIGGAAAGRRRDDALGVNLVLWCLVGVGVILVQVQSWWQYHFLLLFVPVGVLAAVGVDALRRWMRAGDRVLAGRWGTALLLLTLVCLAAPTLGLLARKTVALVEHRFAWDPDARRRYQRQMSRDYATMLDEVAFLGEPGSLPGRIYVFGDPLYHLLSGRGQAIPLNGWFMEVAPAAQWAQVMAQLDAARPPYVFVAPTEAALIARHAPALDAFLRTAYRPLRESRAGVWYVRVTSRSRVARRREHVI
jgi:hypothetical protein